MNMLILLPISELPTLKHEIGSKNVKQITEYFAILNSSNVKLRAAELPFEYGNNCISYWLLFVDDM